MNSQNQFYRYGQSNFDSSSSGGFDQGSWQQPLPPAQLQHSQPQGASEPVYYSGAPQKYHSYQSNRSNETGGASNGGMDSYAHTMAGQSNSTFLSSEGSLNKDKGSRNSQFLQYQQNLTTDTNVSSFSNASSNMQQVQDAGEGNYYGYADDSFNASGNWMGTDSTGVSNTGGNYNATYSDMTMMNNYDEQSGMMNDRNSGMGNGKRMESNSHMSTNPGMMDGRNKGNFMSAGMGNGGNMMYGSNNSSNSNNAYNAAIDNSGLCNNGTDVSLGVMEPFSGNKFQSQMMPQTQTAKGEMGQFPNWQDCNSQNYNSRPVNQFQDGNFNSNTGNTYGRRGKRGRGFGASSNGNRFKGPDMFYQPARNNFSVGGNQQLTVQLNATNHNQWGFLRKNFNKRDDDLAQHLFETHEKFCHSCKERTEERKSTKRKKISEDVSEQEQETTEEPEEELTEEELEMKKLMGFAGFKSTKGAKVKDNSYAAVSCVKSDDGDQDTETKNESSTLTDEERKMIESIGGYSVFSKGSSSNEVTSPTSSLTFGAPAVTMTPREGSGPGYSDKPLFGRNKSQHI
ncbi:uncharacterized protein DDB_G0283357 [Aplysia californica]|uniref:U4/U6.U5 small nuclear ribonucleoprotein 27 kDa protein n=1 Tax=Aplysia californica TaxID=6500 RepID=A0ABM0JBZ9_APLCA|nr:uncharacterized protein DDB_G0283357 [Aplysia californica]